MENATGKDDCYIPPPEKDGATQPRWEMMKLGCQNYVGLFFQQRSLYDMNYKVNIQGPSVSFNIGQY